MANAPFSGPEENFSQEIVLFDNVPGGAGHVRQIVEKLEQVLKRALEVADCGECAEDTSCLNCLRNYGNQIYWEEMKRGPVARFLEAVIHETFPSNLDHLAPGAAHVPAIDKPRWLSQQLLAAEQEVLIAVANITRERPQGTTQNWLEMIQELLRRGVKISLLLKELPSADRARPDVAGLRKHLSLLTHDGLQLCLYCALASQDDFARGVLLAVNHSGDSDSTGAITGNLLGLTLGVDAIPEKWLAELELRAEIEAVAGDLFKQFEDTDAWWNRYPG